MTQPLIIFVIAFDSNLSHEKKRLGSAQIFGKSKLLCAKKCGEKRRKFDLLKNHVDPSRSSIYFPLK